MMRKINTTMDKLVIAFETDAREHTQYLNLETGGIAVISEMWDSFDENGNEIDPDETDRFEDKSKYVMIPGSDPREDFEAMEAFARTVKDPVLKQKLSQAITLHRPFRHFKNVLSDYPYEQKRWFSFQEKSTIHRIQTWLKENNLELEENDKTLSNIGD